MTKKEFIEFQKTGKYTAHPICVVANEEDKKFVPGQSCSIEELLLRQSQGLPMPNLTPTIHTAYNGYDLENLPITAKRNVDIIDVHKQKQETLDEIKRTEEIFAYEKAKSRLKKNKEIKTND